MNHYRDSAGKFVPIEAGTTYKINAPIRMCRCGFHASRCPLRAVDHCISVPYVVTRVRLSGEVLDDPDQDDKSVGSERTVLWIANRAKLCDVICTFTADCVERSLELRHRPETGGNELLRHFKAWRASGFKSSEFYTAVYKAADAVPDVAMTLNYPVGLTGDTAFAACSDVASSEAKHDLDGRGYSWWFSSYAKRFETELLKLAPAEPVPVTRMVELHW